MKDLLLKFENKKPEIIFEWNDSETEAKGWVVINSLRGGAAGGGTRMRLGLNQNEVESLAKTMEVKFTIAGPQIGGAKSGINFDPNDPRKEKVLKRWYTAIKPLLKNYYGTGGDLNVDEILEVIPITKTLDIGHPQEGVLTGFFNPNPNEKSKIISQLQKGVLLKITNNLLTPETNKNITVSDMITGYGVSESINHFYNIYGGKVKNKKIIVQGWGNVASSAAYYQTLSGAKIVGIIDKNGGLINQDGFSLNEIKKLFLNKNKNTLNSKDILSYDEVNSKIWDLKAEIFIPAAASRLINKKQIEKMISNGLELISCGANVPFADSEIFFGPISEFTDKKISVIPDFIANCGMARVFAYLMQNNASITDVEIFNDTSKTIKKALEETYYSNNSRFNLSKTAFKIALNKII